MEMKCIQKFSYSIAAGLQSDSDITMQTAVCIFDFSQCMKMLLNIWKKKNSAWSYYFSWFWKEAFSKEENWKIKKIALQASLFFILFFRQSCNGNDNSKS